MPIREKITSASLWRLFLCLHLVFNAKGSWFASVQVTTIAGSLTFSKLLHDPQMNVASTILSPETLGILTVQEAPPIPIK